MWTPEFNGHLIAALAFFFMKFVHEEINMLLYMHTFELNHTRKNFSHCFFAFIQLILFIEAEII